ncbi:glycosyl hydrolase family 18 protein [Metabacillus sp. GX 13764]|uniref:glycosyl hydrolase family 18 protein n=1 Tax=Metabacillus kandeliae TaxID=2900151 RepID=UPI001E56A8EF|nr:glycosyl hydrolase family 18 protein [Metabacillus kandeliae]MCD7035788.1 glycosyl hydrolase family 18 protein [Metabacillus kandeliae]
MKKLSCLLLGVSLILSGCGEMGKAGKDPKQGSLNQAETVNPKPRVDQISTNHKKPAEVNPADTAYKKQKIESIGFLEPVDAKKAAEEINNTGPLLSYTAFFSYRAKKDGSLIPLNDAIPLKAAKKTGTAPMMVLTNFTEGNFSPEVAHNIFTNKAASKNLIAGVIHTMQTKGYKALNIDFEHIKEKDRELYNGFLETIIPKLHEKGYLVSTALAPKSSDKQAGPWHGAHDYKKHGELADFVILMTYEWGWSGGPPMAVSPIQQVRKVVEYALTVIPKEKIIMGAPLYGYDWTLPYKKGNPSAKRISPADAESLAYKEGAEIKFDNETQSPYYNYKDAAGKSHVVWFENQQSAQAKFEQIKDYKLRGIAYWVLGEPFPENWSLLKEQFVIKKH